jgi:hypothetical protein
MRITDYLKNFPLLNKSFVGRPIETLARASLAELALSLGTGSFCGRYLRENRITLKTAALYSFIPISSLVLGVAALYRLQTLPKIQIASLLKSALLGVALLTMIIAERHLNYLVSTIFRCIWKKNNDESQAPKREPTAQENKAAFSLGEGTIAPITNPHKLSVKHPIEQNHLVLKVTSDDLRRWLSTLPVNGTPVPCDVRPAPLAVSNTKKNADKNAFSLSLLKNALLEEENPSGPILEDFVLISFARTELEASISTIFLSSNPNAFAFEQLRSFQEKIDVELETFINKYSALRELAQEIESYIETNPSLSDLADSLVFTYNHKLLKIFQQVTNKAPGGDELTASGDAIMSLQKTTRLHLAIQNLYDYVERQKDVSIPPQLFITLMYYMAFFCKNSQ